MDIEPVIERRRLADEVAQRLIELIVDGTLAPDSPLPGESEFATRFRVSRTVIREAMRILVAHGMVRVRHGVGAHVNPRHAWHVSKPLEFLIQSDTDGLYQWLETRLVLEMGIVRLAAERANDEELATLAAILEQMASEVRAPTDRFVELDQRFHLTIARATHNPSLAILIEPILRPLRSRMSDSLQIPGAAEQAVAEHLAVAEALQERDPEAAARAIAKHLRRVSDEISQLRTMQRPAGRLQGTTG